MASNLHIWGGLLQGVGVGMEKTAIMHREAALEALRREERKEMVQMRQMERMEDRQWKKEDDKADLENKVGLLSLAQEYKREENETEQAYQERLLGIKSRLEREEIKVRAGEDRITAQQQAALDTQRDRVKADLDRRNDASSKRLAKELDSGDTEVVGANDDGYIILRRKGDSALITTNTKLRAGAKGADDIGGLLGETAPEPKPTPKARPTLTARPKAADPSRPQALAASIAQLQQSGQLGPGTVVGEKVTAPAGALAATSVTLTWNGKRWVPD